MTGDRRAMAARERPVRVRRPGQRRLTRTRRVRPEQKRPIPTRPGTPPTRGRPSRPARYATRSSRRSWRAALGLDSLFESRTYKVYLERLIEDAGDPADPIERMLLEQLALAHFRIGQLHVSAGRAEGIEAVKVYNSVAARMLGEFRRTARGAAPLPGRGPEGQSGEEGQAPQARPVSPHGRGHRPASLDDYRGPRKKDSFARSVGTPDWVVTDREGRR